jgi:hypothetical protein
MSYSALKMEAACVCETSVVFQWTIWHYIPKDRTVQFSRWSAESNMTSGALLFLWTAGLYQFFLSYMHVFRLINPLLSLKLRITYDFCVSIFSFLLIPVNSEVWVVFFNIILSEGSNPRRQYIRLLKFSSLLRSCDIWVNCPYMPPVYFRCTEIKYGIDCGVGQQIVCNAIGLNTAIIRRQ